MSWAVRAYREADGGYGITIGVVTPVGWNNEVGEFDLIGDGEIEIFLAEIAAARRRAREATGLLRESLPGAYEHWPDEAEMAENQKREQAATDDDGAGLRQGSP